MCLVINLVPCDSLGFFGCAQLFSQTCRTFPGSLVGRPFSGVRSALCWYSITLEVVAPLPGDQRLAYTRVNRVAITNLGEGTGSKATHLTYPLPT